MTVAEAIDTKKPTLIAFATPAFCQTRFCGPVIEEVVAPLAKDYRGRANFVHIEPYRLVDEDVEFRLPTELRRELALADGQQPSA